MLKPHATEAVPIVEATLSELLTMAPTRGGRAGSQLRAAVGKVIANCEALLRTSAIGEPLADCFDLAIKTGITQPQLEIVRLVPEATMPSTVGAIAIKNSLIELTLASEGFVIANTKFGSRQDVENLKGSMNVAFAGVEEDVADAMDSMTYRALISLHAAITFHLIETARPLARMLAYQFALPLSTLNIAHRLYADAGRADELRTENKIVHPAFAPRRGRALSA